MWLLISGILILLMASVLHSYCAVGVKAKPIFSAALFWSRMGIVPQIGWMVLFVAGTVILFVANWIVGIISIPIYWLVLPLLITPRMRRYYLGSWEENKDILEKHGYNKDNYLSGDWWKKDELKRDLKGRSPFKEFLPCPLHKGIGLLKVKGEWFIK